MDFRNALELPRISLSSNLIDDPSTNLTVPSGKSCKTDNAVTDFPDPDSPTRDNVFPFSILKEILSTALNKESFDSNSIDNLFISRILSTIFN